MPRGIYDRSKTVRKVKQPKEATRTVSLKEACEVLNYLVKDVKDLCISFDHSRHVIDVLWHEELFQVTVDEVPKAVECIKFLAGKEWDTEGETK